MTKLTKPKRILQPGEVPAEQWELPASYSGDRSRLVSLRELLDPTIHTRSLTELNRKERAELVARRIELQPSYQIMMIGAGIVDKARAIAEVKGQTPIGNILMEIELRAIHLLARQAAQNQLVHAVDGATLIEMADTSESPRGPLKPRKRKPKNKTDP